MLPSSPVEIIYELNANEQSCTMNGKKGKDIFHMKHIKYSNK